MTHLYLLARSLFVYIFLKEERTEIISRTIVCITHFYVGIVADNQKTIYFCLLNLKNCQFCKYLIRW